MREVPDGTQNDNTGAEVTLTSGVSFADKNAVEILPQAATTKAEDSANNGDNMTENVAEKLASLTTRLDQQQLAADESRRQMQASLDAIQTTLKLLIDKQK